MKLFALLPVTLVLLAACSSTGIIPADRDTYIISKQSAAGIFGTSGGVKGDVYQEASEFCTKSGKTVETVNLDVKDAIPFVRTSSVSLQFRCVPRT
jgi:hypothetical protein